MLSLFNFPYLFRSKAVGGYIGAFELEDWWKNELTNGEREILLESFQPMGNEGNPLVGKPLSVGQVNDSQRALWLTQLSSWVSINKSRDLNLKIITKAQSYNIDDLSILDQHFYYYGLMKNFYRHRDFNPKALSFAEDAARSMISIQEKVAKAFLDDPGMGFLPQHPGYKQLAIILEKRGDFQEAILVAEEALKNGWTYKSDWEKRIIRLEKKLSIKDSSLTS